MKNVEPSHPAVTGGCNRFESYNYYNSIATHELVKYSTCSFSGYRPLLSAVIDRLSLAALAVIDCLPVCSSFGGYRPLLVVIDRFFQR